MYLIQILFLLQGITTFTQVLCLVLLSRDAYKNKIVLQGIILTGIILTLILGTTLKSLRGL